MPLTPAQKTTLKTHINQSEDLNIYPNNTDGNLEVTRLLNLEAAPAYSVWRPSVPVDEIMQNGFTWTEVDALTNGKARIWEWMRQMGTINPSKANVRQGLRDCFGNQSATYLGILPHCKRLASRFEKLFATGTGSDASPSVMSLEGPISVNDVEEARNS